MLGMLTTKSTKDTKPDEWWRRLEFMSWKVDPGGVHRSDLQGILVPLVRLVVQFTASITDGTMGLGLPCGTITPTLPFPIKGLPCAHK